MCKSKLSLYFHVHSMYFMAAYRQDSCYCRCAFFLRGHVLQKRNMKSARSSVDQGELNPWSITCTLAPRGLPTQWKTCITVRTKYVVQICSATKYSNITISIYCILCSFQKCWFNNNSKNQLLQSSNYCNLLKKCKIFWE